MDNPKDDALRAIAEFLMESNADIHVERMPIVSGGREPLRENPTCKLHISWWNENGIDRYGEHHRWRPSFHLSWLGDELMLIRSGLSPDVNRRGLALDLGGQFFELADPSCFDQILGAVIPPVKVDDPVRKSVFDGGEYLFDG